MSIDAGATADPVQIVVAVAVVVAALVALFGARRLVCVVGFLVLGAVLSLYWGLIGAPDVALAEAAVGTGVTGALFVAAVTGLGRDERVRPGGAGAVLGTVLGGGLLAGALGVTLTRAMVPDDQGLADVVIESLPATGVEHPVTGVLLNLRSLDTLLEVVVLLGAVAIALAFLPAGDPRPREDESADGSAGRLTSPVLDHFARVVAPVLVLLAGWLLVAGSSQPGGAFQSGAVIAAALIVLHLTGLDIPRIATPLLVVLALGVAAFVAVAVSGVLGGGAWLELRGPAAGPVTVALESALAVTIGASLALLFRAVQRPLIGPSRDGRGPR